MFCFYNNQLIVNFWKVFDLLLEAFQMDNHKYSISFDFKETDEELEIGKFLINIKNEKNDIVYQNCILTTLQNAKIVIKKIQLEFIQNHHISLPYFARNYKNEIDAYHIRNTKFELIQKIHSTGEITDAQEIQKIALVKHYKDNQLDNNKIFEFSQKEKVQSFMSLFNAILEELKTNPNQYFIYIDSEENSQNHCMKKYSISIKDYYNNPIFYKDLYITKEKLTEITNQIRDNFIENHAISLPSIHKNEMNDTFYHHLKNTKFELIIHIQNENDYKDALEAQEKALIKLQNSYPKIYTKKS